MVTKPPTSEQQAANETTPSEHLEELARENVKLARLVAKNHSATSELLQELASSSDVTTRRGVATNPNKPSDVLLHLGAEFPEQLLDNTMFSLLLLENPNLLPDMPLATLRNLLKREAVPVSFLEWATTHADRDVLLAVALNPNMPKTALEKLIQNRSDVAEAARLHVNWAGEMSQGWDEAARTAMKTTNFNCSSSEDGLDDSNSTATDAQGNFDRTAISVVQAVPYQKDIASDADSLSQAKLATLETHWRNAWQQATIVARTVQGKLPAVMERELGWLTSAQLDWRSCLWRYLVQTPTDFIGFDRRLLGRGLYLETLVGESVQVFVAVDTSGSIDTQQLRMFLSEVQRILNSYPHLQCELYYANAEAYGPHSLNPDSPLPSPKGGGGTSFIPFFIKVRENWDGYTQGVIIYLTDGYGTFPEQQPELPVLWVVTPGGLDLAQFPFGEAVRLLST